MSGAANLVAPGVQDTFLWLCCNRRGLEPEANAPETSPPGLDMEPTSAPPVTEQFARARDQGPITAAQPQPAAAPAPATTAARPSTEQTDGVHDPLLSAEAIADAARAIGRVSTTGSALARKAAAGAEQASVKFAPGAAGEPAEGVAPAAAPAVAAGANGSGHGAPHAASAAGPPVASAAGPAAPAAPAAAPVAAPAPSTSVQSDPSRPASAASAAQPAPGTSAPAAAPAVGGAAILARLRAQRAAGARPTSAAPKGSPPPKVVFTYASQTGTAAEIAKNLYAEALQRKIQAEVLSLNELGIQNLNPGYAPHLVVVAASTGDGDPPDNSAAAFLALKKEQPQGLLQGMRFTLLGLGDSNYTRFMHVSRVIKSRLLELGAELFYPAAEADEVDGIEDVAEPWMEGMWEALAKSLVPGSSIQLPVTGKAKSAAPATNVAAATAQPAAAAASAVDEGAAAGATAVAGAATGAEPGSATFPKREEATLPRRDEQSYGLNLGVAPEGADLKGAPAPAPCRIKLVWDRNPDSAAPVRSREASRPCTQDLQHRDPEGAYTAEQPFWADISSARYETATWSDRKVLHLQLELGDSGMRYEAGDSVAVLPLNPPELVSQLLRALKLAADDVFSVQPLEAGSKAVLSHLPCPCTVGYALSHCIDITSAPKKSVLRVLAEHCTDPADKRTLTYFTSKAGREAYQHEVMEHQPSLLDLLNRFPSCSPPFEVLLDALPPLLPRLYSVTTSAVEHPRDVQVALSVVRFKTRYGNRLGVASTWLERLTTQQLSAGDATHSTSPALPKVPILLKRSVDFKPPQDLSKPVLMIGPGTGVAPFRGFMQNRRALLKAAYPEGLPADKMPEGVAAAWLYFGCRREDEDFLYKEELQGFVADRTLTQLRVAFSRAQAHKVYVQDLIRKDAAQVASIISGGGYVFVCGDGAGMAKDVHAALVQALQEQGGMSEQEAAQTLGQMVQERRYIRDVWS